MTRSLTRPRTDAFLKRYASNGRTMHVGCGKVMHRDIFPNQLTLDREERRGMQVDIVGDAHHLTMVPDASFDIVLCSEVLEHLHTPWEAINEFHRVLKPGGLLLITTRFIFPLHSSPDDYFRFTKYGLKRLLNAFTILEIQDEARSIETLAILYQRFAIQAFTLGLWPLKVLWFLLAKITLLFPWVLTKEFSDGRNQVEERNILCSGYYVAARK